MNSFSVSDVLLKSINGLYILLEHDLTIKASNDFFQSLPAVSSIYSSTSFYSRFAEKFHTKFAEAFKSLSTQKQAAAHLVAPVELGNEQVEITWNICPINNKAGFVSGYEVLGILMKKPAKESEPATTEMGSSTLFDVNAEPFFTSNLHGKFITVNEAFTRLTDRSREELLTHTIMSLTDAANAEVIITRIEQAFKGKSVAYGACLFDRKGKKIKVEIINTPLVDNGIVTGINGFVKTISAKTSISKEALKDRKRMNLILNRLKKILDSSLDMICSVDESGKFTFVSRACKTILGYEPRELIGKNYVSFVRAEDIERSREATANIKNGVGTTNFENCFIRKDGSDTTLMWSSRWEENDKRFYSIARDATEKKESELALRASEEKYRILFHNHPIPILIYDKETLRFLEVNMAAIKHYGYSRDEFLSMSLKDIILESQLEKFEVGKNQEDLQAQNTDGLWIHKTKNNDLVYAEITSTDTLYNGKTVKLALSIDRTEQTLAQEQLRKSNEKYYFLSEAIIDGIWECDLLADEIQWNEGARKMFEISDPSMTMNYEWWLNNIHKDDRERVSKKLINHFEQGTAKWEDEYKFKTANNNYKYLYNRGYIIFDDNKRPVRIIGAMQDLSERKGHENMLQKLNSSLEKRATELAESNAELERFAYVASHDLQEPLRMVTSFLQLLEKRYRDKLDNKANEYINYAVDGAERMKRLILDLLEYSRVNSSKAELEDVDINEIVEDLKFTYKSFLKETKGTINTKKLPVVKGNKTQILQLFQNIIGNACKYKSNLPPVIDISFDEEKSFYKFAISDNGIGIDPKFFHKIFIIFQRLHNRDEYSGTGIGLAICKKIVDKHGGKIWVTSTPGQGSTFYFTLPKSR